MRQIIIPLLAVIMTHSSSCKKWLDVDPSTVIKEEEMFEDVQGFRSALFGIYTKMSTRDLYGANLTFGFVDVLAQYYDIGSSQHSFYYPSIYEYTVNRAIPDAIWRTAFNTIANCNNLLDYLEKRKSLFTTDEYDLIKAEAQAIRAFLHFDILRLFAPSATYNKNAPAIPYVNKVSHVPFPQLTVQEVLTAITQDLTEAAAILKEIDPSSLSYNGAFGPTAEVPQFFTLRQERMNYYAVLGTLARVNLYAGNNNAAYENAVEVLTARASGLIFTLFCSKSWDYSDLYFNSAVSANSKLIVQAGRKNDFYETATFGSLDTRYKDWFKYYPGSAEEFMNKYMRSIPQNGNPPNITMMRSEEMTYIRAETAPSETEAITEINKVRSRYGIGGANALQVGVADVELELMKEYRKTFIGEGQFFFYLKRKNMDPIPYSLIDDVQKAYVLPVPDMEKEFGNIKP
ncbi:MAG TPA: RagB/SusD family nutrient uptake outer membrane protein [Parasegetibacter sp.]|jgi:hypothetical protein